jgi:hypothetical protein
LGLVTGKGEREGRGCRLGLVGGDEDGGFGERSGISAV